MSKRILIRVNLWPPQVTSLQETSFLLMNRSDEKLVGFPSCLNRCMYSSGQFACGQRGSDSIMRCASMNISGQDLRMRADMFSRDIYIYADSTLGSVYSHSLRRIESLSYTVFSHCTTVLSKVEAECQSNTIPHHRLFMRSVRTESRQMLLDSH
jgi:hypothetical protein